MESRTHGVNFEALCHELDKLERCSHRPRINIRSGKGSRTRSKHADSSLPTKPWPVPDLPAILSGRHTSSYNELDNRTIYDRRRDVTEQVLEPENASPLPPVQESSRFVEKRHDSQQEVEKKIVLRHVRRTNSRRHFIGDRALVPSVYNEFFQKPATVKSYIRAMFLDEALPKPARISNCIKSKYRPQPNCEYCDVIGNRYCSVCIEYKNRRFAWSYENNIVGVPVSTPVERDVKHTLANPRYAKAVVGKDSVLKRKFYQQLPPIASLSEESYYSK